jgi:hypothetical protein
MTIKEQEVEIKIPFTVTSETCGYSIAPPPFFKSFFSLNIFTLLLKISCPYMCRTFSKIYTLFRNIKHLGINQTRDVKDLCTEKHKVLLRRIKQNLSSKTYCALGHKSILLRGSSSNCYRINTIPVKNL